MNQGLDVALADRMRRERAQGTRAPGPGGVSGWGVESAGRDTTGPAVPPAPIVADYNVRASSSTV
jgi:hypothetical protein